MERDSVSRNNAPTATVKRVTAVLDAFLEAEGDVGVTELAGQLGLAKSVVHRLVTALTDAEYLTHDTASRRYALGAKAIRLGLVALGQMNIRERSVRFLRQLAAETGETATLSIMAGDHRVYAEQVESPHPVRQSIQIGSSAPLYLGASGKAILAFLPAARQSPIVQMAAASGRRANGQPIDAREMLEDLEAVARRGFATSQSERVVGAASAAAPVFDHHGNVVGSISVAGVTVRHSKDDLQRFGRLARACADRLSGELGWSGAVVRAAS